jgi:hypothetical protein
MTAFRGQCFFSLPVTFAARKIRRHQLLTPAVSVPQKTAATYLIGCRPSREKIK